VLIQTRATKNNINRTCEILIKYLIMTTSISRQFFKKTEPAHTADGRSFRANSGPCLPSTKQHVSEKLRRNDVAEPDNAVVTNHSSTREIFLSLVFIHLTTPRRSNSRNNPYLKLFSLRNCETLISAVAMPTQ
jgi:hypothetical protein